MKEKAFPEMSGHIQTVDDHEWEELLLAVDQFVCSYYSTKALTPVSPHTDTVAIIGAVYNLKMSTTTQLPVPFCIQHKQQQNSVARTWLSLLRLLIQAMITTRTIFPNHGAELWSAQNTTKCWQSNQCSTAKSMKQSRNINGTSVSSYLC